MSTTTRSHVHPQTFVLKQPVGPAMPNTADDVRAVQTALARWWAFLGKHRLPSVAQPPSKLQQEIKDFQSEVMRQALPSGVVVPGDATARKLAERPAPNKLDVMPLRPPVGQLPLNATPGTPLTLPQRTGFDPLSDADYVDAAKTLGCEALVIRALALQEGCGAGFDSYNRPVILYEPKHFAILTRPLAPQFKPLYPTLTHLHKPPHRYGSDAEQWQHLQQSYLLSSSQALEAVSWGQFQMLGQYPGLAGFATVEQFVSAMCVSEQEQLKAFVKRIQVSGMQDAMKNKDWAGIAYGYNGSGYKQYGYDTQLKAIYEKLSKKPGN